MKPIDFLQFINLTGVMSLYVTPAVYLISYVIKGEINLVYYSPAK